MKTRQKPIVPRNPFALAARRRKAGAHDKKHKSKRRDARQRLRQDLQRDDNGGDSSPFFMSLIPYYVVRPSCCSICTVCKDFPDIQLIGDQP